LNVGTNYLVVANLKVTFPYMSSVLNLSLRPGKNIIA